MPAMRECLDAQNTGTAQTMPELSSGKVGCTGVERETGWPPEKGWVYFVETEDGQFVKIGFSITPVRRLSQLGTLMPVRLIGCFPGSRGTEVWLHRKFASERTTGEWFRFTPELRALITLVGVMEPTPLRLTPKVKPKPVAVQIEDQTGWERNQAAVMLGSRGGKARTKKLTAEQRSEIARKGGLAGGRGRNKK